MVGWFIGGAVDLTRAIECAVLAERPRIVPFKWFFPLTGLRATESGIDCRVFDVITVTAALWSITTLPTISIFGIRGIRIPRCVVAASQPVVLARTKAGHECREGCHRFRLFLAKVPGEPLIADVVLKSC